MKGHTDSTVLYKDVSHGPDSWVFRFSRLEELLKGDPVRGVTVDDVNAVFINDPALVHAVQVKESRSFARGDLFQKGRKLSRVGLLADNDAMHRHYRKLANPFLRAAKVGEYVPGMRRVAREAAGSWQAGQTIDVMPEMCRITGSIALASLFPGLSSETGKALSERIAELTWATITRPLYAREISPSLRRQPPQERLVRAREEFGELLISYLSEQTRSMGAEASYPTALLTDSDENGNPRLTVPQVCDEALMMMTAATATMASVISWTLLALSADHALDEQVTSDLAKAGETEAGYVPHGYTMRFLMEIMRLYPPVWVECRKTRSSMTLGDYRLPEGVNVVFSPYLLHRRAERYRDPGRLDPDRWLSLRPGDAEYIPFGLGPKVCPGESFAWPGLMIILGAVLREWRLDAKPGAGAQAAGTTLHPGELLMVPQPRRAGA